jgi:hypothetical protein
MTVLARTSSNLTDQPPRQGRDAKENVAESAQDYIKKGVLFQPHHPWTVLRGGAAQQHTATASASSVPGCIGLHCHSGRNECLEAQSTSTKSVSHTPNANSLSLNDMLKVVATVFQQIMAELNGAESEDDRIVAITKTVLNS